MGSEDEFDAPTKVVKHYVGARMYRVRERNTLAAWSAVFSFGCIFSTVYMGYVGWSSCNYYGVFAKLVRGYDASFMPWLTAVIGTLMAIVFVAGALLCTLIITAYTRVRFIELVNSYMWTVISCTVIILLNIILLGVHIGFLSTDSNKVL